MRHYHFIVGRRWARAQRDGTPKPEKLQNMARLLVATITIGGIEAEVDLGWRTPGGK